MIGILATAAATLASGATAPPPATTTALAAEFDLAETRDPVPRHRAAPIAPVLPRNMDTRNFAVDLPEFVLPLAENGPRLLVGALGGRGKGMPKLVHVGLGWSF